MPRVSQRTSTSWTWFIWTTEKFCSADRLKETLPDLLWRLTVTKIWRRSQSPITSLLCCLETNGAYFKTFSSTFWKDLRVAWMYFESSMWSWRAGWLHNLNHQTSIEMLCMTKLTRLLKLFVVNPMQNTSEYIDSRIAPDIIVVAKDRAIIFQHKHKIILYGLKQGAKTGKWELIILICKMISQIFANSYSMNRIMTSRSLYDKWEKSWCGRGITWNSILFHSFHIPRFCLVCREADRTQCRMRVRLIETEANNRIMHIVIAKKAFRPRLMLHVLCLGQTFWAKWELQGWKPYLHLVLFGADHLLSRWQLSNLVRHRSCLQNITRY